MHNKPIVMVAAVLVLLLSSLACAFAGDLLAGDSAAPQSSPQPLPQDSLQDPSPPAQESQATQTPVDIQQPELNPTETPAAAAPPDSARPEDCQAEVCIYDTAFPLQRPVGQPGRLTIDPTLRFGTYLRNLKNAFHGVSFINSTGTPVLAAADGTVVFAGDDTQTAQALYKGYYGSLVVLEHNLPSIEAPLYSLYAHLSQVQVTQGEQVSAGQQIGLVGSSGDISGSALHFEVRLGENHYAAVVNPELWLEPLPADSGEPAGALAGRVLDGEGNYVPVENIVIERLAGPGMPAQDTFYLKTYAEDRLKGDPPYQESFAMAGLPAGEYQISFYYGPDIIQREAAVEAGRLTVVTIAVP